jgi:hypothetical protein
MKSLKSFSGVVPVFMAIALLLGSLLLPVPAASAAQVNADLADAAKQACISSLKDQGYTIDKVVSIEPSETVTGVDVDLDLTRDGQQYAITCEFVTDTNVVDRIEDRVVTLETTEAPDLGRVDRASAVMGRDRTPEAKTAVDRTPRAAVVQEDNSPELERVDVAEPVVMPRSGKAIERPSSGGLPPVVWLLPLLILPFLFLYFRQQKQTTPVITEKTVTPPAPKSETATPATYVQASSIASNNPVAGVIRNQGNAVNIYANPDQTASVTGQLSDNQLVTLSGRYENDWAELANGGWIEVQYLEKDPRVTA